MNRFSKQANCPPAETLAAYEQNALTLLAQQATTAHLRACEFCAAQLQLLGRAAAATAIPPVSVPPLPLALRLYAQTLLAAPPVSRKRAA